MEAVRSELSKAEAGVESEDSSLYLPREGHRWVRICRGGQMGDLQGALRIGAGKQNM